MTFRSLSNSSQQFNALAPHYDELMDVVPYAMWAEYVLLLCDAVEHKPRRLLDCACGTGNVSFELSHLGLEVTGVDIAPGMIAVAQGKVTQEAGQPVFLEADLTEFELQTTFDTATCLYDSLNYILDPEALEAAFANIAHHLEPGGIFVFDMNSVFALTTGLFTQNNHDSRKNLQYDWTAHFDTETRVTSVEMRFERSGPLGRKEKFSELHQERAYELSEVTGMLERTGWQLLRIFDAYTLNRIHDASERWFFVAQKGENERESCAGTDFR